MKEKKPRTDEEALEALSKEIVKQRNKEREKRTGETDEEMEARLLRKLDELQRRMKEENDD